MKTKPRSYVTISDNKQLVEPGNYTTIPDMEQMTERTGHVTMPSRSHGRVKNVDAIGQSSCQNTPKTYTQQHNSSIKCDIEQIVWITSNYL
ncbi:hypothetical protein Lalb_Chr22g0354191 [Lupinus albus]|uniref:Uncharacterized protein n=1 Tax=Lupinus albus TaxID=3870 RepID=A0A6A4NLT5_LUPAL|nr:hypothetical protein Lalb_Chr22g0354191 [Lupinus albus]